MEVRAGQARPVLPPPEAAIGAAAFSRDHQWLALAIGRRVQFVAVATGQITGPTCEATVLMPYRDAAPTALSFSPDASCLVAVSMDGLRIWEVASGRLIGRPPLVVGASGVEYASDHASLVTASHDGIARRWAAPDPAQPERIFRHGFNPHPAPIFGLMAARHSPDGRRLITWGLDGSVASWATDSGAQLPNPFQFGGRVSALFFVAGGEELLTHDRGRSFRRWDLATGLPLTEPLRYWRDPDRAIQVPLLADRAQLPAPAQRGAGRIWSRVEPADTATDATPWLHVLAHPGTSRHLVSDEHGDLLWWSPSDLPLPAPGWLAPLAEALVGRRVDPSGVIATVPDQEFFRLRAALRSAPPTTAWGRWVDWFLADRSQRRLAWSSSQTVPELIARLLALGGEGRLRQAALLDPAHPEILLALARNALADATRPRRVAEVEAWCRQALALAPDDRAIATAVADLRQQCQASDAGARP